MKQVFLNYNVHYLSKRLMTSKNIQIHIIPHFLLNTEIHILKNKILRYIIVKK